MEQEVHRFDANSNSFSKDYGLTLADAATALATHGELLVTIMGTGCKNFLYRSGKLVEESDFEHDIHVSTTEAQSKLVLSMDGSRLVVASDSGPVRVLKYPECEQLVVADFHSQGVNDLEMSRDGQVVGTSARDNCTFLWRTDSGEKIQLLEPVFKEKMRSTIKGVRFSPVDDMLLFAVESNPRKGGTCLSAWRNNGGAKCPWVRQSYTIALNESVSTFGVSPNGKLIAVASTEGHMALLAWNGDSFRKVWNTENGGSLIRRAKPSHALPVTAICFDGSSQFVFSASADWTVAAWPVRQRLSWFALLALLLRGMLLIVVTLACTLVFVGSKEAVPLEYGTVRSYQHSLNELCVRQPVCNQTQHMLFEVKDNLRQSLSQLGKKKFIEQPATLAEHSQAPGDGVLHEDLHAEEHGTDGASEHGDGDVDRVKLCDADPIEIRRPSNEPCRQTYTAEEHANQVCVNDVLESHLPRSEIGGGIGETARANSDNEAPPSSSASAPMDLGPESERIEASIEESSKLNVMPPISQDSVGENASDEFNAEKSNPSPTSEDSEELSTVTMEGSKKAEPVKLSIQDDPSAFHQSPSAEFLRNVILRDSLPPAVEIQPNASPKRAVPSPSSASTQQQQCCRRLPIGRGACSRLT